MSKLAGYFEVSSQAASLCSLYPNKERDVFQTENPGRLRNFSRAFSSITVIGVLQTNVHPESAACFPWTKSGRTECDQLQPCLVCFCGEKKSIEECPLTVLASRLVALAQQHWKSSLARAEPCLTLGPGDLDLVAGCSE